MILSFFQWFYNPSPQVWHRKNNKDHIEPKLGFLKWYRLSQKKNLPPPVIYYQEEAAQRIKN